MNCCERPYRICDTVPNCMETLFLQVPEFDNPYIYIRITNGKGNAAFFPAFVDAEEIEIDLTDYDFISPNFLNPYGGDFTIEYLDGDGHVLEFSIGGIAYDHFIFNVGEYVAATGNINF